MIITYIIHGIVDWTLGISFIGNYLDMLIELGFPFLIIGISGKLSIFDKNNFQRYMSILIAFYFTGGWVISTIFHIPIVTGKYPAEEVFDGKYFRIEQGGQIIIAMSDNFHGTNIRYYKKYWLFEYRCKNNFFYKIKKIDVVEENSSKLIFKPKYYGISEIFPTETLE